MKYKYQEATFSCLMLLIGVFLLAHTYSEQYQHLLTGDEILAPMFYPRIVLYGWCAMAAGMMINAMRLPDTVRRAFNLKKVVQALCLMLVMLGVMLCFGFVIAAVPFVFCFSMFLGYRRKWVAATASLVIPALLYVLFDKGLGVILPAPIWQF